MDDDNMFFSGSVPNLISEKAIRKINKILKNSKQQISTTSENHLIQIYQTYIKPNLFALIVFLIIIVFLLIRYILKVFREEQELLHQDNITEETESSIEPLPKPVKKPPPKSFQKSPQKIQEIVPELDELEDLEDLTSDNESLSLDDNGINEEYYKELEIQNNEKYKFDRLTHMIVEGED
jgi:hypothetical protein